MLRILMWTLTFFWASSGESPADRFPEGKCQVGCVPVLPPSWTWSSGSDDSRRCDCKLLASGHSSDGFTGISFLLNPPEAQMGNLGSFQTHRFPSYSAHMRHRGFQAGVSTPCVGCYLRLSSFPCLESSGFCLGLSLPSPSFPFYLLQAAREVFLNANPIMSFSCLQITACPRNEENGP